MSNKLELLGLPFSTDDYIELKRFKVSNTESYEIDLNERISVGPFLDELTRPLVKNFKGKGILIVDHDRKSNNEILSAIKFLNDFDKGLYSLKNGIQKLSDDTI